MADIILSMPDLIMTKLSNNCDKMFPGRPVETTKLDWLKSKLYKYLKLVYEESDKLEKIKGIEIDIIDL